MTVFHVSCFGYMSYFFRLRRVGLLPTVVASGVYTGFFGLTNNIGYKAIVDRKVMSKARQLGLGKFVQPCGKVGKRGLNYTYTP